ncbi:MAG: hypothetical protein ACRDTG_28455 [Pseudonocardiaceae bacterium]
MREAHGVLKDLRREMAEHKAFIRQTVVETIRGEVALQIEILGKETERAVNAATAAVYREFDRITAILMGQEDHQPTLEELAKVKMWIAEPGEAEDDV